MRLGTHTRGVFAGGTGIPPHSGQSGRAVCSAVVPGLLDRRLIFVTGKGGVGKSTVATALGVLAARHGLRTIVAELASQARIRDTFAHEGDTFEELQLSERLFTISIDPQRAMEEYLHVKTGSVGQVLGASRLFQAFAMATPGMRELLSIGKVWELAQPERRTAGAEVYDLVIVDSPAAGHGVGILRTPRTFADIARVGPIAHQGRTISQTIADPEFTAVVAVATAEEMPVNETLWLRDALAEESLPLDTVIVNARYPSRFTARERKRLEKARAGSLGTPATAALRAALSEHARFVGQQEQLQRLHDGLGLASLELPYLFTEAIGPPELDRLADALEPRIPAPERV
jgi:anion-transporting  ArsA/GET3 family ATPase